MNTNATKAASRNKATRPVSMAIAAVVIAAWASVSAGATAPSARDCTPSGKSTVATKSMKGDVHAALEDRAIAPLKRLTGDKTTATMVA